MSDAVAPADRTMVVPGGIGATQQMPAAAGGDAFRTQMGGTAVCPVCQSTTPLMETYCGECGFLLTSTPVEGVEPLTEEGPAGELLDVQSGLRHRLHAGVNTVGRQGTDVIIQEGTVSRVHARITLESTGVMVEDLSSTNGTKVGDRRIGPNQPTPASSGMTLRFGNWNVVLEIGAPVAQPADRTIALPADQTIALPTPEQIAGSESVEPAAPEPSTLLAETLPDDLPIARLEKIEGPSPDILISEGGITIGRRAGNDILLTNDAYISGRHAQFTCDLMGTYLTDLGSTNGTSVNEERLQPNVPQLLLEGDMIQLGQTKYRFVLVEAREAEPEVRDSDPLEATHPVEATHPEPEQESAS